MKTLYLILSIVMFLLVVNGCSNKDNNPLSIQENDAGTLAKSIEEQEVYLSILAQQLAVSLNDQGIVDLLTDEFESTNTCEGILNFSDLLSKTVNGITFSKKITSESLKGKYNLERIITEREINDLINSFDYGLDFYFPVAEHRESWKSTINKVLVAYPPLSIDDSEWEKIIACTLNGNKQPLSAKTPPTEPVLIISPCEHYGDHSIEKNNLLKKTHSTLSGEWRMTINHFYLYDANEPWPGGDAEIYVKIGDYDWTSGDDRVEQYWHWPDENDPETKYVEVGTTYKYWYYGAHNEADLYMGMELYID